jgi:CheY-specific phosphatase CheX
MALNFQLDEALVNAMIDAGEKGFKLGSKKVTCVSVGRTQPMALSSVSGIIGIAGRVNGSILVNMSEPVALLVTSGILMTEFKTINSEVLDGIAEVTNVIGGRLKSTLAMVGYPLDNITLPAVIVGQNYFVSQSKGMMTYNIALALEDDTIPKYQDRVIQIVFTVMASELKATH